MVTVVSGNRLPVLSVTVPMMPPSVRCATAEVVNANDINRVYTRQETENLIRFDVSDIKVTLLRTFSNDLRTTATKPPASSCASPEPVGSDCKTAKNVR